MVKVTNRYGNQHMIRLAHPGTADITGCSKDGRFIAIECKVRPNKLTVSQAVYLAEVKKRGGIAIVAYDLKDVEAVM